MPVEENLSDYYKNVPNECNELEKDQSVDLQKRLNKIAKKEGFVTFTINTRRIVADGSNYLADLIEATIKGRKNNTKDNLSELDIFIKSIPALANVQVISVTEAYTREVFAYTTLLKIYGMLQEDAKIPLEERYKFVKCYEESNSKLIIMENIVKKGYEICNRFVIPPLKFMEKSVRQLAKFHGLSFILERKQPSYFNEHLKTMPYPINMNDDWECLINKINTTMLDHLDEIGKKKLEKLYPIMIEKFKKLYGLEHLGVKCLLHGDYRVNNVMVKLENGEVSEVMPVDYQMIYYGHPIADFLYFIFGATDAAFRQKHINELKNMYFDTMAKLVSYFDANIEDVYPRKEFEKDYTEHLLYGLMMTVCFLPFTLFEDGDQPDLISTQLSEISFKMNDKMKTRLQGTIDEFINLGYL